MWTPYHKLPSFSNRKRKRADEPQPNSAFLSAPVTAQLHVRLSLDCLFVIASINTHLISLQHISAQCPSVGVVGHSSMQGWRSHMEDAYIMSPLSSLASTHSLLAVFDGHAGDLCAKYCAKNLGKALQDTAAWAKYVSLFKKGKDDKGLCSKALVEAYVALDKDWQESESVAEAGDMSGCAAVCCVVTPTYIVCANAGDSRCVVGSDGETIALSDDHKPENLDEAARITAAGGFVQANRVMGELAMSRALGDFR